MPMAVAVPQFRHGKLTRVFLAQKDASKYLNSAETAQTIDTKETSSFGTVSKTYIPGTRDATMSIGGMYDGGVGELDEMMAGLHGALATYPATFAYDALPLAVGRITRLADVYQASYDTSSPADDIVSVSGELTCNNGVRMGYVLNGENPVTTTVTGTAVDAGASSATTRGGMMHVHVLSNTRSTAVDVKTQVSTDNSIWTDLLTQTVPAGTVAGYCANVNTGTVARYMRALITPTAGTGSAVIIVAFGRN